MQENTMEKLYEKEKEFATLKQEDQRLEQEEQKLKEEKELEEQEEVVIE